MNLLKNLRENRPHNQSLVLLLDVNNEFFCVKTWNLALIRRHLIVILAFEKYPLILDFLLVYFFDLVFHISFSKIVLLKRKHQCRKENWLRTWRKMNPESKISIWSWLPREQWRQLHVIYTWDNSVELNLEKKTFILVLLYFHGLRTIDHLNKGVSEVIKKSRKIAYS